MTEQELEVSVERLQAASKFVGDRADDLRTELDALTKGVDDLLDDGWQGIAAEAFTTAWEEWRDGARRVQEALGTSSNLLADNARAYDDQETDNAWSLGTLSGDI